MLVFPVPEAPKMAILRTFKGQPWSHSSDSSRVKRYVEIHLLCTWISISKAKFLVLCANFENLQLFDLLGMTLMWLLWMPLQLLFLLAWSAAFESKWKILLLTGDGELFILLLLPFHIFLMKLMKRFTRRQKFENVVATFVLLRLHFSPKLLVLVINLLFVLL